MILRHAGEIEAARRHLDRFEESKTAGFPSVEHAGTHHVQRAALSRDEGHSQSAEVHPSAAADRILATDARGLGLLALWATVSAAKGRYERAARLLGAALAPSAYLSLPGHHPDETDPYRDQIHQALGANETARLMAEDAAMTIEDAVAHAPDGRDHP